MSVFRIICFCLCFSLVLISGCNSSLSSESDNKNIKIGMMLADYGLGDQSFNDAAFSGLIKARDELGIIFDYRDLQTTETYEQGLIELIEDDCDLIIGLGFNMIDAITKIAMQYPNQQFLFIDGKIDVPNITSISFKEDEGSFIVGVIAGLKTKTNTVGFIGGMDIPVIQKFRDGFITGVKTVNPKAKVIVDYAHDFGAPEVGRQIARKMIIEHQADIIYPAAGYTGLGAIEEIADQQKYAIGVDSDQFFLAENTVITSMMKHLDVAVFSAVKTVVEHGSLTENHIELGISEDGVGAAPIRVIPFNDKEKALLNSLTEKVMNRTISIQKDAR